MFGDGHGGTLFTSSPVLTLAVPQGFAVDADGNQTIDLVSPSGSYFPGNGHGGFGNAISLALPQSSTLIAVADMNGDGKPDFIVQSGTNVSVVLNSLTAPASFSSSTAFLITPSAITTSAGLPVTLSASVQSYGGVPTGSVTFFDGAQSLGSAAVNIYGIAALNTSFAAGGVHNLSASFTGTLDPATNTLFLNSNGPGSTSISVNTSQPTASAPAVTLTAFPNPARVGNPVTFTATVTGSGTPTGLVVFTADGNVLGISPLPASLTVPFPAVGLHNVIATYGGDATFPQASSTTLVEDVRTSVAADFTINPSPQTATIKAGQTATFNITINPVGDLASTVGFSCSGLPAAASCSFSPATLTPGINPVSTTLTLTTTAPSAARVFPLRDPGPLLWVFTSAGFFSALLLFLLRGRRAARRVALIWAAIVFAFLLGSCGGSGGGTTGGGSNGTPPGTSSVTVTATSATSHTTALTITVTP
ncbi:MAG TPA: Ig-like domain repeat protein [Candidatus Angelobacter sp.]|nr:Ig-like domain repeat protein [Candidatus Angelobacter sp.]